MKQQRQGLIENIKNAVHDSADQLSDHAVPGVSLAALERASRLQREAMKSEVEEQLARHQAAVHEELTKRFKQQGRQLQDLSEQLEELNVKQNKGGFPWLLIGLIGAGVYVWRTPKLRSQVLEWLGQVSPQARDAVEKLGDRAGQAVDDIQGGTPPGKAVKNAARDTGQQVKDAAQDVKHGAQDLKDEAGAAIRDTEADLH